MRAAVLVLIGCTAGVPDPGGGSGDPMHDAAIDARGGPPIWTDAPLGDGGMVDCKPRLTTYGDGHHYSGRNCQDGCHAHGFTLSGTVYTGVANNSSYAGATMTIHTANGQTIDLVVGANGNFYTSQPIAFPATVRVSSCPYSTAMAGGVTSGACNAGGCHAQLGGAQIHLP